MADDDVAETRKMNPQRSPVENQRRDRLDNRDSEEGYGAWMLVKDKKKGVRQQARWKEKGGREMQGARKHDSQKGEKMPKETGYILGKEEKAFGEVEGGEGTGLNRGKIVGRPGPFAGEILEHSGDIVESPKPKPMDTISHLVTYPGQPQHSDLSKNIGSELLSIPNPNFAKVKGKASKRGEIKGERKGFGANGVSAGRVSKLKEKKLRKRGSIRIARTLKNMEEKDGKGLKELERRDISREVHIIIDLTQVSLPSLANPLLRDQEMRCRGGQSEAGRQEPVMPGAKDRAGEFRLENGFEVLSCQPEALDPGDSNMGGKEEDHFQFISQEPQQVDARWMEEQACNMLGIRRRDEGCSNMQLEGTESEEEAGTAESYG